MSNIQIIDSRWKLLREDLREFKSWYTSYNKNTQDRIQEIFDSYNITYENLYKSVSKNDESRLKRKISYWKNKGLYKDYFKYRIEELSKKGITYIDLLEILLYGALIEEQETIEMNIGFIFDEVAKDCYNQGRKELKKKPKSIIPFVIFASFNSLLVDGCNWRNYIGALVLTNMQEIYRHHLINLQQGIKTDIYGDLMQSLLEKQRNRLVSVNDDKYSGGLDKYATALGNIALIEAGGNTNQKIKFISDRCEHVTEMCEYMDGMIFNTKDRNKFKRPVGSTSKDLTLQDIDIYGLVVGINQPPITNHFHWCHSTLTYLVDKPTDDLRTVVFKKTDKSYEDLTKQLKNMKGNSNPIERRLNYSIDSDGNKHYDYFFEEDKNLIEEIECQKQLEKITGYKVYLNPKTFIQYKKTPDFWIEDTDELWDLKGINGDSDSIIDNILSKACKKKQTPNLILKSRKTSFDNAELKQQLDFIFDNNYKKYIKQIILIDDHYKVIVYYKR